MAGEWAEASRLWAGLGCPYEAALALHDASDEAALRQALKIFTSLGAAAAAQLTRHKMRQLGIRAIPAGPRTATRTDPLGLTRREREVLGPDLRRAQQRRDRRQAVPLRQDRRSSRLRRAGQTGRPDPQRRRRPRRPAWAGRHGGKLGITAGKLGNHADSAPGPTPVRSL